MKRKTTRRHSRRISLYAAFTDTGEPVLGVWEWQLRPLISRIEERKANGDGFPSEHPVNITIAKYNRMLSDRGHSIYGVRP